MKNVLKIHALVFQILLFCCSGWLYAHTPRLQQPHFNSPFAPTLQSSKQEGRLLEPTYQLVLEKSFFRICSEENEDNDLKVNLESTYTYTGNFYNFFNTQNVSTFICALKSSVRCEHWLYSSSHRNVVLRVMRI